ncbi:hypothetical protein [Paenibacillus rigui]|uniref:DNA lyase n=1 Tax=Paenibacillus rigui TaxID=554312 RepID=A0A229UK67_9BACL|nr:hypothetical protein [Paenibacillus rigui]OXM83694.1 hypothetical protein CF651_24155 [Paenibacillus rigui]
MVSNSKADILAQYTLSLANFEIVTSIDGGYNHIGATIVDGILQSGLRYETVVKPRVDKIRMNYPDANTSSKFLYLLERVPASNLLQSNSGVSFKGRKPDYILKVTNFFIENEIETEEDLKKWLELSSNERKLKKLKGIGNKTVDYFKILVGIETTAIDRHLENFIKEAGVIATGYKECQDIINDAAELLKVNKAHFDYSIWKYMSNKS